MRILHVTPYYAGAWAYGGIPRLAAALARGVARRGHAVTVCTTDACDRAARLGVAPGSVAARRAWPAFREPDGVDLRVFPNLSNALAYHLQLFVPQGLGAYLRAHAHSFDVAHLHAYRNLPGVMAARHLRRAGVPYVLAPNGTAPRIERRRLAKRVFDLTLGRDVLSGAAGVVAVSEAERGQLRALGVRAASISVVPNPIDLSEFEDPIPPGSFRARFGIDAPRVVLFLGKLTPRKRVDLVLRALAALRRPDTCLAIVGNDMGAGGSLRRLAVKLGLGARTRFTGLLAGRARLEALTDADVVVYPGEHEVFGLVPLEAILCGTPVVVADDSGCGEVVGRTGGGRVVRQGDPAALADAMADMLDGPTLWRDAAREAATRVRALCGADEVAARMEELYRQVLATGAGCAAAEAA